MKKMLCCLLICLILAACASAEESCPICGGTSELCLTDECGAVYCSGTLISYPEEQSAISYTVREGTYIIGEGAFGDNEYIEEVIIPEGVAMIDTGAFEGLTSLKRVTLPGTLLIIGESAFYNCPNLEGVILPPRLYAIGPSAFVDNWKMTTIDMPETVRYIGSEAFSNTGLTEMWIRTIDFEYGYGILHPGYRDDPAPPVTIHMCDAVIEEELGSAIYFYLEYEKWENLTFQFDIPYFD